MRKCCDSFETLGFPQALIRLTPDLRLPWRETWLTAGKATGIIWSSLACEEKLPHYIHPSLCLLWLGSFFLVQSLRVSLISRPCGISGHRAIAIPILGTLPALLSSLGVLQRVCHEGVYTSSQEDRIASASTQPGGEGARALVRRQPDALKRKHIPSLVGHPKGADIPTLTSPALYHSV